MNYLIRITLLILISSIQLVGQEDLMVTGEYEWYEIPEKRTIEFSFSENGKTCGPNTEFETIGEQFAYLKFDLLENNEMANQIKETFDILDLKSNYPKQSYSYQYESLEDAKLFHDMAKEAFAENLKLYHYYKEDDREEVLEAKHFAVQNAIEKAEFIAEKLGYKNVILLSIDEASSNKTSGSIKPNRKVMVSFESKHQVRKFSVNVKFKMI